MAIFTVKYVFAKDMINLHAQNTGGVYGLYDNAKLAIYYGKSDNNLKQELQNQLSLSEDSCIEDARFFNTEINYTPNKRMKELLDEHMRVFERLPKCNES